MQLGEVGERGSVGDLRAREVDNLQISEVGEWGNIHNRCAREINFRNRFN